MRLEVLEEGLGLGLVYTAIIPYTNLVAHMANALGQQSKKQGVYIAG